MSADAEALDKAYRAYWTKQCGADTRSPGFATVQRRFLAWADRVARTAEAVRNPSAPGAVAVMARAFRSLGATWDWTEHPANEIDNFADAILAERPVAANKVTRRRKAK